MFFHRAVEYPDVNAIARRRRNPFGMSPPCRPTADGEPSAVYGYGEIDADVHVIGDHPGRHGGRETGIPFTGVPAGRSVLELLEALELVSLREGWTPGPDQTGDRNVAAATYEPRNLFCSYLHMCRVAGSSTPTEAQYADLERFFDAELRAVNAHVLVPVGARPVDHVIRHYTTRGRLLDGPLDELHATEVRGRGFLVVPLLDPEDWTAGDFERALDRLRAILARDYRQTKGVPTLVG